MKKSLIHGAEFFTPEEAHKIMVEIEDALFYVPSDAQHFALKRKLPVLDYTIRHYANYLPDLAKESLPVALRNLLDKLDEVDSASKAIFEFAALHDIKYVGPKYEKEKKAAREILNEIST